MTLQQCRYILAISEYGTLNKAAQALFVTQPTLSKALADLETSLDIQILHRNNQGSTFTDAGKDVLFYATMLLEQADAMTNHFHKRKHEPSIQFSISSLHYTFALSALKSLLAKLESEDMSAQYEIDFREGKSTDVLADVANGKSQLGIIAMTQMNNLVLEKYIKQHALTFIPIKTVQQHVYFRKNHSLSAFDCVSLQMLSAFPRLTYKKDDLPLSVAEEGNHLKFAGKIIYLNDRASMDYLLATTDGYNIGTGCLSEDIFHDLIEVRPLQDGQSMEIGYLIRRGLQLDTPLLYYIEQLKNAIE